MLSSMVATSCMLETSASSQFSASEKNGPGNSSRAHSSSSDVMPMETSVGASFQASSTSGVFHPLGQSLFRVALLQRVHAQRLFLGERILLQLEHALLLLAR